MEKSTYNNGKDFLSGQYIEYDHPMCPIYFDVHIEKRTGTYWITGYISYEDFPPIEQHVLHKKHIYTTINTIVNQMQNYATTALCKNNLDISQHEHINLIRYIQQLHIRQNQQNIAQYITDIYHYYQQIQCDKQTNQ